MTSWHLLTGEFPPDPGGVSDYSHAVARALADAGDKVHVWCPEITGPSLETPGVEVHRIRGGWSDGDYEAIDTAMNAVGGGRRLLVQWVPHAYGRRSLNVAFCRWVRRRAEAGDEIDLMVHEPGLGFREGSLKHDLAAAVHRLMLALLLSRARRVWTSTPSWEARLKPWSFGRRDLEYSWLPIPSNIPVVDDPVRVQAIRATASDGGSTVVVGHFSTYPPAIRDALAAVLPVLLRERADLHVRLLGRGSDDAAAALRAHLRTDRVSASGAVDAAALSGHLQACDVMLQPYPEGATLRRSALTAALAHGLPVVTTTGLHSEPFWTETAAVLTVPAEDREALAAAVLELAGAPERRRQLGAAARAAYGSRLSLAHVIDALRADKPEAA